MTSATRRIVPRRRILEFLQSLPEGLLYSLWGVLHGTVCVLVSLHVLLHKTEPQSAVLWIGVIWLVPVGGVLLYGIAGVDRLKRRAEDIGETRRDMRRLLEDDERVRVPLRVTVPDDDTLLRNDFVELVRRVCERPILGGHDLRLLHNGEETFPAMLEDIRAAEHHVHLQTYILGDDPLALEFRDLLAEKARQGVQVRLLYDAIGSARTSWLPWRQVEDAGGSVSAFRMLNLLRGRMQINLRNHRKILVTDGRVGWVGGINISDDYFLEQERGRGIRDFSARVAGDAVHDLQQIFLEDWYWATGEQHSDPTLYPEVEPVGDTVCHVVASGPDEEHEKFYQVLLGAIGAARDSILLVTPYFVPDKAVREALRTAALRGVDVRILVPEKSDQFIVGVAQRAFYDAVVEAGCRLYERPGPFLHAKALVVDDVYTLVGSANVDQRSFQLNFECNVGVFGAEIARECERAFLQDLAESHLITTERLADRGVWRTAVQNACALFSPIL